MSINSRPSIRGFIAKEPRELETQDGAPYVKVRFGQERKHREEDGSFTQTETTYHHLVMFGRSAEHAHANFAQGDNFVAEGYTRPVSYERNGQAIEGEEFVAKKIGHDAARTRYEVDRTPRNGVGRDAAAYDPTQRAATAAHAPVSM